MTALHPQRRHEGQRIRVGGAVLDGQRVGVVRGGCPSLTGTGSPGLRPRCRRWRPPSRQRCALSTSAAANLNATGTATLIVSSATSPGDGLALEKRLGELKLTLCQGIGIDGSLTLEPGTTAQQGRMCGAMSPTTVPPQVLDRSALTARYDAARAAGNHARANAVRGVLIYLDHRSRVAATSGRDLAQRYDSAPAEQPVTVACLCWRWAAAMFAPEIPAAVALAGARTTAAMLALAMSPTSPPAATVAHRAERPSGSAQRPAA